MSSVAARRRVLISGSTGLIGRRIVADCRAAGDDVVPLVRKQNSIHSIVWDPVGAPLDPASVSGFDAVIHLAGEPIAGRWTAEKKRRIYESRVGGTAKLAEALAGAKQPPKVFLCASGINYYGDRGEQIVDEETPAGNSFLSEACVAWEQAAIPLAAVARVVHLRIGMVLAPDGGALATMLPLYRMGLGGPIAGGRAYVSWVTIGDLARAVAHCMVSESLNGPVNVVSPEPVTGRVFTAALARAVHRPAVLPIPAWAVRLMVGELAEETVLCSIRAIPERLTKDGFHFQERTIDAALTACVPGSTGHNEAA